MGGLGSQGPEQRRDAPRTQVIMAMTIEEPHKYSTGGGSERLCGCMRHFAPATVGRMKAVSISDDILDLILRII